MSDNAEGTAGSIVDFDEERERGILTPHDRAFLLDEDGVREDMTDNAIRQKRYAIRQRFKNAVVDIQYLLLLDDDDVSRLFDGDELDEYEVREVHGSLMAAVYHLIRAEADREDILAMLNVLVANDVTREYAEEHGVYPPVEDAIAFDVPPVEECPSLEAVRAALVDGDEIPERAHMALEYGGIHPNRQ